MYEDDGYAIGISCRFIQQSFNTVVSGMAHQTNDGHLTTAVNCINSLLRLMIDDTKHNVERPHAVSYNMHSILRRNVYPRCAPTFHLYTHLYILIIDRLAHLVYTATTERRVIPAASRKTGT